MVEGWDEGGEQQHEWIDDRRSEGIECIYIYRCSFVRIVPWLLGENNFQAIAGRTTREEVEKSRRSRRGKTEEIKKKK